jgi:hypothetical protein
MMAAKRSLQALRKWVKDTRASAQARGDGPLMNATWVFTYKPAEDPDESQEITEDQFFGTAEDEHPRPGTYEAKAVANPESDDEVIIEGPKDGVWNGDGSSSLEKEEPGGIQGALNAIAKASRSSVELASAGEARAMRRAKQAEEREADARKKLEENLDAMSQLRSQLHTKEIERQQAVTEKEAAEAARDAALADLAEFQREGGELAPLASAAMNRVYQLLCNHLGEPALAMEKEAMDESFQEVCAYLIDNYITLEDGQQIMLALFAHYNLGMPWRPLRVIFFTTWGVDFKEPPPADWRPPPPVADDEEVPAAQEIH